MSKDKGACSKAHRRPDMKIATLAERAYPTFEAA